MTFFSERDLFVVPHGKGEINARNPNHYDYILTISHDV
jgi:hypothetical protein